MGKERLLGIFLFFPLGNSAQIYYSYDFRGNLISMRGSSWGHLQCKFLIQMLTL